MTLAKGFYEGGSAGMKESPGIKTSAGRVAPATEIEKIGVF